MKEFFHMDGYAFYVWTSIGLFLLVSVYNIWIPWLRHRKTKAEIRQKLLRNQKVKHDPET